VLRDTRAGRGGVHGQDGDEHGKRCAGEPRTQPMIEGTHDGCMISVGIGGRFLVYHRLARPDRPLRECSHRRRIADTGIGLYQGAEFG